MCRIQWVTGDPTGTLKSGGQPLQAHTLNEWIELHMLIITLSLQVCRCLPDPSFPSFNKIEESVCWPMFSCWFLHILKINIIGLKYIPSWPISKTLVATDWSTDISSWPISKALVATDWSADISGWTIYKKNWLPMIGQ